jgi:ParB/RepB/Spo0J family partition protein
MGWKSKQRDDKSRDKSGLESKKGKKKIPQTQEDVLVADVQIVGTRREPDPKRVKTLAASISMVGLRTPITVRRIEKERDGVNTTVLALVAGGYRLEAFKALERKRIPAFVIEGDKSDARVLQLTENLYRADLTALQRAEDLAELIELVHAEKGGQLAQPGGKQPHDRGVSRAAKALGFSRRAVRRSRQIANITVEAKVKAIEAGFDKKQSMLLTIADLEGAEAQLAKIDEMIKASTSGSKTSSGKTKSKKKASDEAASDSDQDDASPPIVPESGDQSDSEQQDDDLADWDDSEEEEPPHDRSDSEQQDSDDLADWDTSEEEEQLFSALKTAWDTASQSVRKRFVKKVLNLDLDQIDNAIWTA